MFPGFSDPAYLLAVLTSAANYGLEILVALLPELTLMVIIVYLIKVVGIELGRGRSKIALGAEGLAAAREALGFVIWLYLLQIHFVETAPILAGYFF